MATTPPPLPGKGRRFPWFTLISCCIGIPIAVAITWHFVSRWQVRSAIRSLDAESKAKGDPVSIEDLIRNYGPVAETNNAAIPLRALWESEDPEFWKTVFDASKGEPEPMETKHSHDLPVLGIQWKEASKARPLTDESLKLAEEFLSGRSNFLARAHAALRRGNARFPIALNDGLRARLPHLAPIKWAAQVLKMESMVRAEKGDLDGAIASLAAADKCGSILADDPTLIGRLVAVACHKIAADGFVSLIARGGLSGAQMEAIEGVLDRTDYPKALTSALVIESAFLASLFNHPNELLGGVASASAGGSDVAGSIMVSLYTASGSDQIDLLFYRQTMARLIGLSRTNSLELLKECQPEKMEELIEKTKGTPPKWISSIILPPALGAPKKFCEGEFNKRALLTAIGLERFREKHGRYPANLEETVPAFVKEVPQDPFDGKSLRYRSTKGGFLLYSVGPDLEDNGGAAATKQHDNRGRDLVVEITGRE